MQITLISTIFVNFVLIYLRYDYRLVPTIIEGKVSVLAIIMCVASLSMCKDNKDNTSKKPLLLFIVSLLLTFQSLSTL